MIILGKVNLAPLLKAQGQFDSALTSIKDDLDRTGAIKLFEICYELSWKTLKKTLEAKGYSDINNPKDVFRDAAKERLIDDPEIWFAYQEQRNLTVHTYNEETAEKIFDCFDEFQSDLNKLVIILTNLK